MTNKPNYTRRIIGISFIAIAVVLFIIVWFKNSNREGVPLIFSDKTMLETLWSDYKNEYLEPGSGRTLDKQQNNITTSEGESYTLLRSVWMDDKTTFDLSYTFMNDNMKRKEDNLYSWLFGEKSDGTYGIETDQGGYNTASDADTDITLALVFASKRWNQTSYLDDAKKMMGDIWDKDVVTINGVPYMTADDLEKDSNNDPIVNPSYFSPYAYRIFSTIDPNHNWLGLVQSSYDVLNATASSTLDKGNTVSLPPDWVVIDRKTGQVKPTNLKGLDTNFGYDALRAPWRVALDYQWYKDPQAKAYLDKLSFLSSQWKSNKTISSVYAHDGTVVSSQEVPAMYGGDIGYFAVSDPSDAIQIYNQKLRFLFNPDDNNWKNDLGYYDANWVWFGIGLYDNLLPNLSK